MGVARRDAHTRGQHVRLTRQDNECVILVDGKPLMSSRRHGSEDALAALACPHRGIEEPHVLVGGLGMGFTLRATLDLLPPDATVTVVELLPAIVEWNRGPLGSLAGYPLRDRRVRIEIGDVGRALRASDRHDSVASSSTSTTAPPRSRVGKRGLYDNAGVSPVRGARDGGVLAVWSARDDRKFEQRLRFHGFNVQVAASGPA